MILQETSFLQSFRYSKIFFSTNKMRWEFVSHQTRQCSLQLHWMYAFCIFISNNQLLFFLLTPLYFSIVTMTTQGRTSKSFTTINDAQLFLTPAWKDQIFKKHPAELLLWYEGSSPQKALWSITLEYYFMWCQASPLPGGGLTKRMKICLNSLTNLTKVRTVCGKRTVCFPCNHIVTFLLWIHFSINTSTTGKQNSA